MKSKRILYRVVSDLKGKIQKFSYIIDVIGLKAGNHQTAGIPPGSYNVVPMGNSTLSSRQWF